VEARADLAILEYFVGQLGFVFNDAESIFEKEVGDAREEAYGLDAVQFGFFNQRAENAAACALSLGFRLDYDRADFAQMWAVEVERAAAEEDTAIGFGNSEVADVLAYLRKGTLE
jgi:hypothetical protein